IRKKGKTERRNHPDFCINKFGIYLNRGFEFVEGGIQIALQLVWIHSVVEAVDRPSPLGEAAPVADARRELLVFEKRLELIVALWHRSLITFVIGPLNLRSDLGDLFAGIVSGRCARHRKRKRNEKKTRQGCLHFPVEVVVGPTSGRRNSKTSLAAEPPFSACA